MRGGLLGVEGLELLELAGDLAGFTGVGLDLRQGIRKVTHLAEQRIAGPQRARGHDSLVAELLLVRESFGLGSLGRRKLIRSALDGVLRLVVIVGVLVVRVGRLRRLGCRA